MSVGTKLLQAAAGNAGEAVYVDDLFSCFLYEGNATSRNIVNGIDLADKGGLVWTKNRDDTYDHNFVDSARGLTNSPYIRSNTTGSQGTDGGGITVFNSDGYTVGNSGSWNANGNNHVSWTFAKQEKFFDIVTYTGDGNADRQINHNLGSVPGMIIIKKYVGSTTRWAVFHRSLGTGKFLSLDDTAGVVTQSDFWQTAPTATQFTVETNGNVNNNGDSYVAYLFGHNEAEYGENSDEAIIYCDSFTTTSTWGNFKANIGFEPQWILVKRTDSSDNWIMLDMMRGVTGPGDQALIDTDMFGQDSDDQELKANSNAVESTQGRGGFYSKGYLGNLGGFGNATYIYMAIRRPNKPASEFAANKLFSMDGAGNASGDPDFVSNGHIVDWAFLKLIAGSEGAYATARPTGSTYISFTGGDKEYSDGSLDMDFQSGFGDSASGAVANYQAWMFRRAKGFFDIVTYVGDNTTNQQVAHNLGVAPELMILKLRNYASGWPVYTTATSASGFTLLNSTAAYQTGTYWGTSGGTAPTATNVTVDGSGNNSGVHYILLLFATVAGISKVGGYTGTGSDLNVDCGFSAGARFILIKRTDSTGDWYVYDSVRGIVAGDDPYFLLNSSAAQVTNTDYIDPLSSGFTVTSSAPAGLNASSGTYIFLAIA